MRERAVFVVWGGLCGLLSACSLLTDTDLLTRGLDGQAGRGGAATAGGAGAPEGGISGTGSSTGGTAGAENGGAGTAGSATGGASGFGAACVPSGSDAYCDGLDENCNATLKEAVCPSGCTGSVLDGTSYMACTTSAPFNQAEVLCEQQHMHLVKVDTASENAYVDGLAKNLGSYVWIGGSDQALNGSFAWQGGGTFYAKSAPIAGVYQNFASNEPSTVPGRDCVQLHSDPPGYWLSAPCSDALQFVCERY